MASLSTHPSILLQSADDPSRQAFLETERLPYLVPGYRILTNAPEGFAFQAIVNCNIEDFWGTLHALLDLMPEEFATAVYEFNGTPEFQRTQSKARTVEVLERYRKGIEANSDLMLVFDANDGGELVNLNVEDGRYFVFSGMSLPAFRNVMQQLPIPHVPKLATLDEFPRALQNPTEEVADLAKRIISALIVDE